MKKTTDTIRYSTDIHTTLLLIFYPPPRLSYYIVTINRKFLNYFMHRNKIRSLYNYSFHRKKNGKNMKNVHFEICFKIFY